MKWNRRNGKDESKRCSGVAILGLGVVFCSHCPSEKNSTTMGAVVTLVKGGMINGRMEM
jgi:hypothetical protein